MKILKRAEFGNPVLRRKAKQLKAKEIKSPKIQNLIRDMRHTLEVKKYGVGLAGPQVGESVAITVLGIKPTPSRPNLKPFEAVIINPKILHHYGKKQSMWEGCISMGSSASPVFAKTLRYPKIRVKYLDDRAVPHEETFEKLKAHLLQHEIDHLQGILFVDRVEDTTSYMNVSEYKKRIVKNKKVEDE